MATFSKPARVPRWADTGTRVEPSEGQKDSGWTFKQDPPFSFMNDLQGLAGDWLQWLNERFSDGVSNDDLQFVLGRFGIGGDPTSKLQVIDTSSVTSAVVNVAGIKAKSTGDMADNFGPGLTFQIEDTAAVENLIARIKGVRSAGADDSGSLVFQTANAGTLLDRLFIREDGKIAIGAITPSELLDVDGNIALSGTNRSIIGNTGDTQEGSIKLRDFSTGNMEITPSDPTGASQRNLLLTNGNFIVGTLTQDLGATPSNLWRDGFAERWHGIKLTGNAVIPANATDLVARHAQNAVLVVVTISAAGVVNDLSNHFNVDDVTHTASTGVYIVNLDVSVDSQAASLVSLIGGSGEVVAGVSGGGSTITVRTNDSSGSTADKAFNLVVIGRPLGTP